MTGDLTARSVRNEQLRVKSVGSDRVPFGPNLDLFDCEVEFDCAPNTLMMGSSVSLTNCLIRAKRPLTRVNFNRAKLESCRFEGEFKDCDFGRIEQVDPRGGIKDCDFSAARLDDCRFFKCDLQGLKLPQTWPQLVLAGFHEESAKLFAQARTVGEKVFLSTLSESHADVVAVCRLAKNVGKTLQLEESALQQYLRTLPFVRTTFG